MIEIRLRLSGNWGPSQWGGGAWLYLPHRMLRVWAAVGSLGSRRGFYRTRLPGDELYGLNWRGGPAAHQIIVLAHTCRIRHAIDSALAVPPPAQRHTGKA